MNTPKSSIQRNMETAAEVDKAPAHGPWNSTAQHPPTAAAWVGFPPAPQTEKWLSTRTFANVTRASDSLAATSRMLTRGFAAEMQGGGPPLSTVKQPGQRP